MSGVGDGASVGATRALGHHDVLLCRSCGRTTEVDCVDLGDLRPEPGRASGFVVDEAEVVFHGLCPDCR
jgi:Fur family ferric uptake transcriptional regulator